MMTVHSSRRSHKLETSGAPNCGNVLVTSLALAVKVAQCELPKKGNDDKFYGSQNFRSRVTVTDTFVGRNILCL